MNYSLGQFVGSIIAVGVLCALLRWIFKRFLDGNSLILTTVAVAVGIATFAYAFGSADGGDPKFGAGLVQYGFGGVVVLIAWLFSANRKDKSNG